MRLKNIFKVNQSTINNLENIKEPFLHSMFSGAIHYSIDTGEFVSHNLKILIRDQFDDLYYVFQVDAMNYYFNEVIENEIDTFLISSEKTELSAFTNQFLFSSSLSCNNPNELKILNIDIYGEERTRKWNERKTIKYFNKVLHEEVEDYLFAPRIVVFSFSNGNSWIILANNGQLKFAYTNTLSKYFFDQYYSSDYLDMTLYEKWELKRMSTEINLPVPNYPEYSDEKIIKKLYEFNYL